MNDADRLARSRFLRLSLLRLAGIMLFFLGMTISLTDLVRPGGLRSIGIPLALLGLAGSLILPKVFARRWRTPTAE